MKNKMLYIFTMGMLLLSGATLANDCELTVEAGDSLKFNASSLSVPSTCGSVTLNLKHGGKMPKTVMGHNWVLSKTADVGAIASDGIKAYTTSGRTIVVKENDERVIAHTTLIGGGETTSITFSLDGLSASESYTFFCSFPGHAGLMRGAFNII